MRDHWTYSCDFIRSFVGANVPRGDAAALCKEIATALGIPHEQLSKTLGDHYLANEDAATDRFVSRLDLTGGLS